MHRLADLSFQFYQGHILGPKVFRQETLKHGDTSLVLCIVGASHVIHLETPQGNYTEAVADPTRLPEGALYKTSIGDSGSWDSPQAPFSIHWKTIKITPELVEQLKGYPLVHDFGENALTAIKWQLDSEVRIETAHVYPEDGLVALTESRIGTCLDTSARTKACLVGGSR